MDSPDLEAPLESLVDGPTMDQLSDDQLRARIIDIQNKRVSSQAMQAHIRASVPSAKVEKKDAFSEF